MYFFDFIKNIVKKNNLGCLIWLIVNTVIVTIVLGSWFGGRWTDYVKGVFLYIIVLALCLSPLGEAVLRLQSGCSKIKRKEHLDRLVPLFNEVYAKSKEKNPDLPNNIQLYMSESEEPNAFATGRKTVCITRGLLRYPDQQIKSILAHEFGHLAHKDTDAILIIAIGNLFVSIIFVIFRIIIRFISFMVSLLVGYISENIAIGFAAGFTHACIDGILGGAMWLWTKLGVLLCLHSSRENEKLADQYSFELGYGEYLCYFLDRLPISTERGLWAALNASHPDHDSRIAYLQELGCSYQG